jgi:hypothetical protein
MESVFSLRYQTFCNPLVRHLLEGKMFEYEVVQRDLLRHSHIWPISLEDCGVEAELAYRYDDRKMLHKSFQLRLMLRLSENTDKIATDLKWRQGGAYAELPPRCMGDVEDERRGAPLGRLPVSTTRSSLVYSSCWT